MKTLEIGKNYGSVFGLNAEKGQKAIYLGGNLWRAEKPGASAERESEDMTEAALEYINRPSVFMG